MTDQTHLFIALLAVSSWSWLTSWEWYTDAAVLVLMAYFAWWKPNDNPPCPS